MTDDLPGRNATGLLDTVRTSLPSMLIGHKAND